MDTFLRRWRTALVAAGCLLLPAALALGQGGKSSKPAAPQKQVAARHADVGDEVPTTVLRMRFEVIELALSPEQIRRGNASIGALDLQELGSEAIQGGRAQVKYAFDASVLVGWAARFVDASRIPLVRGQRKNEAGQVRAQINYEEVGCSLDLQSWWLNGGDRGRVSVSMEVEVSEVHRDAEAGAVATEGLAAPVHRQVSQELRAIVPIGAERWFSSLSSLRADPDEQASARVYVYRIRLDREGED